MPKCDFSKVVHLKLHYGMGVVLYICDIFSEHLFIIKHLWRAASIHNISRYFCEISICDFNFHYQSDTREYGSCWLLDSYKYFDDFKYC